MATLGYSNLIIDEIQAYSPETSAVIVKTIEETTAVGGNFLLMTATLPEYIRTKIIERTKQATCSELTIFSKQGEKDISKNKIHLVDNGNAIDGQTEKDLKSDPREFSNTVKNILKQHPGKRVLITINTVKNSQQLYSSIIDDQELLNSLSIDWENVLLLHSRFIGKHREEKVRRITECDESDKDLSVIKILITTQVIEASVDIDYDILISELAALDSLIQRMGRVNRNRGDYSQGKGDAYIINGFLSGAQYIYKWETMPLTSGLLKNLNGKTFSEKEKEKLIREFYTNDKYKKVIEQFNKNMHALDNLLLASSKREAQRIFREVNSVTVIPLEQIGDFENEFLSVIRDEKNFRIKIRKLLLDYSTSIRFTDFINMHYVELGTHPSKNEQFEKFKKKLKLKNFFRGYYVITDKSQWEYNEGFGLMKKEGKEGKKSEPTGRIL
jgi:CRISPR-associated endonuclease/helicase Cas3